MVAGGNSAHLATYPAGDGVHVGAAARAWIADSTVRGGDGHATAGSAAIRNLGSVPVAIARSSLLAGPGNPPGPTTVGPIATRPLLGHSSTTPALVLGTTWSIDYLASPTTPVLALWSDHLDATPLPLLAEMAWLPLAGFAVAGAGATDAAGLLTFTFAVPANPALLHAAYFVQSVAGATLPLEASPPVGGVVR